VDFLSDEDITDSCYFCTALIPSNVHNVLRIPDDERQKTKDSQMKSGRSVTYSYLLRWTERLEARAARP